MNLFAGKKGEDEIIWLWRIVIMYAAVGVLMFFSWSSKLTVLDTEDVVFYPLADRVILSDDCFAYVDQALDKTISGSIDYSKFTQERMDRCFSNIESKIGARITLKTEMDEHGPSEFVLYHKKELFDEYNAVDLITNDVTIMERRVPVTVLRGNTRIPGVIGIEIGWYEK